MSNPIETLKQIERIAEELLEDFGTLDNHARLVLIEQIRQLSEAGSGDHPLVRLDDHGHPHFEHPQHEFLAAETHGA